MAAGRASSGLLEIVAYVNFKEVIGTWFKEFRNPRGRALNMNRRLNMKLFGSYKSRMFTNIFAFTVFAALAMPVCGVAQNIATQEAKATHHHYKLIGVGTLGGPSSFFSGPILQILNNRGTFAVIANTPAANPNPGCNVPFSFPDCFVEHAAVWHDGTLLDLGVLAGGANSQTVAIGESGGIAGSSEKGL